jgi:hypothetical protein
MKTLYSILLTFIVALAGCNGDKVNLSSLKPAATRTVGKLTIVLLNKNANPDESLRLNMYMDVAFTSTGGKGLTVPESFLWCSAPYLYRCGNNPSEQAQRPAGW